MSEKYSVASECGFAPARFRHHIPHTKMAEIFAWFKWSLLPNQHMLRKGRTLGSIFVQAIKRNHLVSKKALSILKSIGQSRGPGRFG